MGLAFFNREALVSDNGNEYEFSEEDFEKLNRDSLYWHNPTDPST